VSVLLLLLLLLPAAGGGSSGAGGIAEHAECLLHQCLTCTLATLLP
jgi:hypothetical protein